MIPANNTPKIVHIILRPSYYGFRLVSCFWPVLFSSSSPSPARLSFLWGNLPASFRASSHLFLSFPGRPSSSDICVQNSFWRSALEHPYHMPSPLQSFNMHMRNQANVFIQSVGIQFFKYRTVHMIR